MTKFKEAQLSIRLG